jgi:hypothetical protein
VPMCGVPVAVACRWKEDGGSGPGADHYPGCASTWCE